MCRGRDAAVYRHPSTQATFVGPAGPRKRRGRAASGTARASPLCRRNSGIVWLLARLGWRECRPPTLATHAIRPDRERPTPLPGTRSILAQPGPGPRSGALPAPLQLQTTPRRNRWRHTHLQDHLKGEPRGSPMRPGQPHRADSPTMSGPQTARTEATLAASPSNVPESPCQKARSRVSAVLRPAVSTVREVRSPMTSRCARHSMGLRCARRPARAGSTPRAARHYCATSCVLVSLRQMRSSPRAISETTGPGKPAQVVRGTTCGVRVIWFRALAALLARSASP